MQNKWCTLYFSHPSTLADYETYLQPCFLNYHIICVKSQSPTPCRPDLWTAQTQPPSVYRRIAGVIENHQLADLLMQALAKLSRGYNSIRLHPQNIHFFFGSWVIYCKGTSVRKVQDILLWLFKMIWIRQLSWVNLLLQRHSSDSVWWYMKGKLKTWFFQKKKKKQNRLVQMCKKVS